MHIDGVVLPRPRIVAGALLLGIATAAAAQQEAPATATLERIEVTGSRIARIDGESGLPVQIITRDELIDGGVQTMQELLERISANQSYGAFTEAQGLGKLLVGFTGASLRGLGSQRTLVLLNGRRLAPYALSGGQSVDLSGIPASAIERVEVLKDGASAIYGTDAIGGVINFILTKDYQGAELNANYYATEQGGGNNGRVSLTAGTGSLASDKFNVFVTADFFKQDSLGMWQRDATKTAYLPGLGQDNTSGRSFPANITQTDPITGAVYGFRGEYNPTIPFPGGPTSASCSPPASYPTSTRPLQCRYDFPTMADAIPASEKANVLGRFTWQLAPEHQFFAEASYYRGKFTQRIAPNPVHTLQEFPDDPITLPPSSPYYPTAFVTGLPHGEPTQPVQLDYRTVELGPRTDEATVQQWTATAGLQGDVNGWDYTFAVNYTENQQVDDYVSGIVYRSKFGALLRSGVVNPFGVNTPEVLDLMRATQVVGPANDNRATNAGIGLQLSNNVYDLPAGPLAIAFGAEGRRESLEQTNSDFIVSGDVAGGVGAVPSLASAQRNVWSLFGEANIPIVRTLELNAAVRYDHYSDFGGTTNPKFTLRWQPVHELLVRGAWGTGFRAPTLSDLFQPQQVDYNQGGYIDPIRCPDPPDDSYDCSGEIRVKGGGNPLLQPETSQQATAGIVVAPVKEISASVDYYWIKVDNVINVVPLDTILGPEYATWGPDYVVRRPPDAQHPGMPGEIAYVVQYPTNAGQLKTSGIDVNLQLNGPPTDVGRFALTLNGTYVIDYEFVGYHSDALATAGTAGDSGGAVSRYRQYAQLNWTSGAWGATLANTYQSGYSEWCNGGDPSGCERRRVGAYSIWDMQARYTGLPGTTLALGIRNAMDTPPPVTTNPFNQQQGIDPSYADPRGRIFYGAITYAFK